MTVIENIINELSEHHRDKSQLLESYVTARLNKSLSVYYSELMRSNEYLENRKNKLKVMKNINKG